MPSDNWTKISRCVWEHTTGDRIMRFRMIVGGTGYVYLNYPAGESFDGGDYTSHDNLRDAKQHTVNRYE